MQGKKLMASREDLVARIGDFVASLAASGQTTPKDFAMETDLTLPQIRILYMLSSGPARITDISQAQGMARANASAMVERLVRKGLVERVPYPKDRRVALACLTNEGRDAAGRITRSESAVVERITKVLSDDELEVVARALEIIDQGAKRLDAANEDTTTVQEADE